MAVEQSNTVLAIDPGGTTGFCYAELDAMDVILNQFQERASEAKLMEILQSLRPQVILCEDFQYRNRARKGLDLTPVKLIGVVQLYCAGDGAAHNAVRLIMQTPATGKAYFRDSTLKMNKVYRPGMPHAMDATRHFMQWFTFGEGYRFNNNQKMILV